MAIALDLNLTPPGRAGVQTGIDTHNPTSAELLRNAIAGPTLVVFQSDGTLLPSQRLTGGTFPNAFILQLNLFTGTADVPPTDASVEIDIYNWGTLMVRATYAIGSIIPAWTLVTLKVPIYSKWEAFCPATVDSTFTGPNLTIGGY